MTRKIVAVKMVRTNGMENMARKSISGQNGTDKIH